MQTGRRLTRPPPLDAPKGDFARTHKPDKANIALKPGENQAQKNLQNMKKYLARPPGYDMNKTRPRTSADNQRRLDHDRQTANASKVPTKVSEVTAAVINVSTSSVLSPRNSGIVPLGSLKLTCILDSDIILVLPFSHTNRNCFYIRIDYND